MENGEDQKRKEMLASMKSAQSNMKLALDRIEELEAALKAAARNIGILAKYLPDDLYCYNSSSSNQVSARKRANEYQAEALKNL